MVETRIKKLGGQRYALYVNGEYSCSGSYDFVKSERDRADPLRILRKLNRRR